MSEEDKPKQPDKGQFTRDLKIEGIFLHVRAIIEQGRTEEFIKTCKEAGYQNLKAQEGLVAFARNFILAGPAEDQEIRQRTLSVDNLFFAIRQKNPDIC